MSIKYHDQNVAGMLAVDATPASGSTNPVSSGGVYSALADKQNTLTFDSVPTAGSSNPVTSSGIRSALDAKADKNDLATIHQTSPTCTETNGIAAGVFFYLDNELVVAKTAIANGATFTNGTNYEFPTAGGLNALKSAFDVTAVQVDNAWTPTNCSIEGSVAMLQGNILQLMIRVKSNATSGLEIQTPYKGYIDYAIFPVRSFSSPYAEIGTAWLSAGDGKLRFYGAFAANTKYYIVGTAIVAL